MALSAARHPLLVLGRREVVPNDISLGRPRTLSLRVQANNVFNTPQFTAIDTVVNSPTFGQVTGVRPMRSAQFVARAG